MRADRSRSIAAGRQRPVRQPFLRRCDPNGSSRGGSFGDSEQDREQTLLAGDRTLLAWCRTAFGASALAVGLGGVMPAVAPKASDCDQSSSRSSRSTKGWSFHVFRHRVIAPPASPGEPIQPPDLTGGPIPSPAAARRWRRRSPPNLEPHARPGSAPLRRTSWIIDRLPSVRASSSDRDEESCFCLFYFRRQAVPTTGCPRQRPESESIDVFERHDCDGA